MTPQTEQEIEKLRTLNDNYTELVDIFDHLVPREYVVLTLSAPSDVDWTMYSVVVTNNDKGTSDTYVIPSNGVLEFEVKYDTTYTIKLPVLGDFITPKDLTFTAGMKMREVGYSYRMAGVFGIDANGKFYTIEQIEALEDKSIIKYGGYTDEYLEGYQKADGTYGCGFMWDIEQDTTTYSWSTKAEGLDTSLVPMTNDSAVADTLCDGENYTKGIISECKRLGFTSPAAEACVAKIAKVGNYSTNGYMFSWGQCKRLLNNITIYDNLYNALGIDSKALSYFHIGLYYTSVQYSATNAITSDGGGFSNGYSNKGSKRKTLTIYNLP